jgi:DNA-binding MarR family transcriptional regulator
MSKKSAPPTSEAKVRELATEHGLSLAAADAIASIDVAMTRIRRSMARRELARTVMAKLDADLDIAHLDVISAISGFACDPVPPNTEVTVGFVAEQMNVDPSRASRLVAEVVDRGYARRVASQQDSRRICLELTEEGEAFVDSFRAIKWNTFASSLGTWSEADLKTFAKLIDRFSSWSKQALADNAPPPAKSREKQDA